MNAETIIRALTACSLAGLLLGVGLRLTIHEVVASLKRCRLALIIAVNFIVVPLLVVAATRLLHPGPDISAGMILLAAAPFAPVVPVFTRMARADLALAAGLSSLFPLLCVFISPLVIEAALRGTPQAASLHFNSEEIFLTLFCTITVPLALGMAVKHFLPKLGQLGLKPVEMISEATGAISLTYVTLHEWPDIVTTGWLPLLVMLLLCEISKFLGYTIGGPARTARQVVAFGTGNRNIALALLIALESFPGTPVIAAVVANGLVLILCGLVHVGIWRFGAAQRASE